jgi:hypothetical protein
MRSTHLRRLGILTIVLLGAACSRQPTQSDGNGPGNADGAGGRADPPTAPAFDGDRSEPAPAPEAAPEPNPATTPEPN